MNNTLPERLQRLVSLWGPAGREHRVAGALEEMIRSFVDEVRTDPFGNLIAVRRGAPGSRRVMLAAHMDTAGALAVEATPEGMIRLAPVGDWKAVHLIGQRVVWENGTVGVIQCEPGTDPKDLDFRKLWCDIGAGSRDEALERVSLGEMCTLAAGLQAMGDGIVVGAGLDNRAGCAVLLEVAERLGPVPCEVIFAFTCQGSVGARGGGPAAYGVRPDAALVVDTAPAAPGGSKAQVRLGQGPALRLKDGAFMAHFELSQRVRQVAEEAGLPLQTEISPDRNHGDARAIAAAAGGVPTAVLDLPVRYLGTAGEMAHWKDLTALADLLRKVLQQFG